MVVLQVKFAAAGKCPIFARLLRVNLTDKVLLAKPLSHCRKNE